MPINNSGNQRNELRVRTNMLRTWLNILAGARERKISWGHRVETPKASRGAVWRGVSPSPSD